MKELMVTLLVLSCTGMVWAQQNDSNGIRTQRGSSSSGALGRSTGSEPPVVPIVDDVGSGSARRPQGSQSTRSFDRTSSGLGSSNGLGSGGLGSGGLGGSETRSGNPFSTSRSIQSSSETLGNPTSRILDPNRRVRDSFSARPTENTSLPSTSRVAAPDRVESLGVPTEAMDILRSSGIIEAGVSDPFADRVTISDRNVTHLAGSRDIRGSLRGNTLVFSVTQDDLQFIRTGALQFDVPENIKGKYRKATIEYPPALNPTSRTSGAASRTNQGFQADDSRWRLAGDTRGRTTPQRTEPIRNSSPWDNSNNNLQLAELQRQQQQRAEYDRWLKEKESREKLDLADRNRELQDQLDRLRWDQQQALARTQQQVLAQTQPTQYRDPRYADNSFLQQQVIAQPVVTQPIVTRPVVAPVTADPMGYSVVQARMQQMEARMAQLQNENMQLSNDVRNVRAEHEEDYRRRFDIRSDRRNELAQSPNHTAGYEIDRQFNGDKPLNDRLPLSVGGFGKDPDRSKSNVGGVPEKSNTASKSNWELLMFLMLIFSVGLNLYLWALSRGFYLRYHELADELRETFTVAA